MPPTRGASRIGEIDGGFACYVGFAGDAFEVKVEKRLGHEGFPEFLAPIRLSGAHPPVRDMASHRRAEDRTVLVDVDHNRTEARCVSLRIERNAASGEVSLEKYQGKNIAVSLRN